MSKEAIQLAEIFRQLPLVEKLHLIELFFRNIREETMNKEKDEEGMRKAALLLYADYQTDKELTAFTVLDGEDYYEKK